MERGGSLQLHRLAGLVAGFLCLAVAAPAAAAPVTVDLRIEGKARTLFEAPVTVDVRSFHFTGEAEHTCDGTAGNGGPSATPVPTRGGAITQAAEQTPFAIRGAWSDTFGSPTFSEVAGESVAYDPATGEFLGEYKNGSFSSYGACGDPVAGGDRVLFAYGDGSETLLALAGPTTARPGESVTVKVTNAANGDGVSGVQVGGATTAGDGTATVGPLTQRGDNDFKADRQDGTVIRSNRLRVCVTDGADGACGTRAQSPAPAAPVAVADTAAPVARIRGIRNGQRFARRRAPRTLRGSVSPDPSGLRAVKLSLTRSAGGRCQLYSPTKERFRRSRCGRRVNFSIGDRQDWSYLLPRRLGKGRYVLDAIAVDKAGNRDPLARGRNRVVFFVR